MEKEQLSDDDLYEMFDEFLDEVYGQIKIGPYDYDTSTSLKRIDPIAYNESFNNWLDNELTEETIEEIDGVYYKLRG